jgi:hypothetical protein
MYYTPEQIDRKIRQLEKRICCATQPSYTVYSALLTQTGTDAPVVTVLENTLGEDIVWTRDTPGVYIGTGDNDVLLGATTWVLVGTGEANGIYNAYHTDNIITLSSIDPSTLLAADGLLTNVAIEIRIYP